MYTVSAIATAVVNKGTIQSVCLILNYLKIKRNKTNVIKHIKSELQIKGSMGIEYIGDEDNHLEHYEGWEEDVEKICKELGI